MTQGLRINRRFTEAGRDPYDGIEWSRRDSRITNPDGSVVFEMTDAEIPAGWSQRSSIERSAACSLRGRLTAPPVTKRLPRKAWRPG